MRQNYAAERRASPGRNNPGMVGEIIGIRMLMLVTPLIRELVTELNLSRAAVVYA